MLLKSALKITQGGNAISKLTYDNIGTVRDDRFPLERGKPPVSCWFKKSW